MGKLAINIVLLPPEEVMKLAKSINKKLIEHDDMINFVNGTSIPHNTLCMGGIEEEDLPKLSKILEEISKEFAPINLTITGTSVHINPTDNSKGSGFVVANTRELQKLHEKVVRRCKALFVDVSTSDMHPSGNTRASSAEHANKFLEIDCFELYKPHISIGIGEAKSIDKRVIFTAKRLAICHLGNWCTCRKILFETELRGEK